MTGPTDRPMPDAADLAARRATKAERSTRADLFTVLGVAIVAAIFIVVTLVLRLMDIFGPDGVTVPVYFSAFDTSLPETGGAASVSVDEGYVVVSGLPVATFASVLLAAVVPAIASLVVVVCSLMFFRRLLRNEPFAPGNARLLSISSIAILCAWLAESFFGTLASNGALAIASDRAFEGVAFQISWLPVLAAMAVGGLAIAFRAGERLRADTERLRADTDGLV